MNMVVNREYVKYLTRINKSVKKFRNIYNHPPNIAQISEDTGLTEEHILEALEFGSKSFWQMAPRMRSGFYNKARA